jgi:transposase InsO family protein
MSSQGQRPPAVRLSAAQPRAHREPGADCPLTHPQRRPQRGVRPTTPRRRRPSSAIPRRGYRAGKLYLAAVEDLFSRRLLGFAMSDRHDAELAVASLRMAAAVRGGSVSGVIFHTDQGSEGGFNRSSQHLDLGGVDGQADSVDESAYWTGADEVSRGAAASAGSGARVLA